MRKKIGLIVLLIVAIVTLAACSTKNVTGLIIVERDPNTLVFNEGQAITHAGMKYYNVSTKGQFLDQNNKAKTKTPYTNDVEQIPSSTSTAEGIHTYKITVNGKPQIETCAKC